NDFTGGKDFRGIKIRTDAELDLAQLGRGQPRLVGPKPQLLRAAAGRISIPVENCQRCAASPNLSAAVGEAQPAGAAGQVNRRVVGEDKASELFDRIADLQQV